MRFKLSRWPNILISASWIRKSIAVCTKSSTKMQMPNANVKSKGDCLYRNQCQKKFYVNLPILCDTWIELSSLLVFLELSLLCCAYGVLVFHRNIFFFFFCGFSVFWLRAKRFRAYDDYNCDRCRLYWNSSESHW